MCGSKQAGRRTSISRAKITNIILHDKTLFGDAATKWKGAPTTDDAHIKRLRITKRLRRFSGDFESAAELAAKLQTCGSHHRCRSGACPECARAFQRWFVAQMLRFTNVA